MAFPSPVGGASFGSDFAPSIIFAVLYGLLTPLMMYRMFAKSSRTTLLIGSLCFSIERVVIFSLRASQSQQEGQRISKGLATYMQVSFGMGFIGVANDLVGIVRCLLVNPTFGSNTYDQSPAAESTHLNEAVQAQVEGSVGSLAHEGEFPGQPAEGEPDHPNQRFWSRRFSDFTNLAFLAAFIPGILANSRYASAMEDEKQANRTMNMRYASSAVALFLTITLAISIMWARMKMPRASKKAASILISISILLSVTAIYRLSVMFHKTDALTSREPGSLNSSGAKASFYILHVLPEWLATVLLFVFNIRRMLAAGPFGDWRSEDETEKERAKRLAKEAKKAEQKKQLAKLAATSS